VVVAWHFIEGFRMRGTEADVGWAVVAAAVPWMVVMVVFLFSDRDRAGGASTPCSPWPAVSRSHEQPGRYGDLDARGAK